MGGGAWSTNTYTARQRARAATGLSAFAYHDHVSETGLYEVHETLDPKWTAGPASPLAGQIVREARDSDEHPESVPIAVFFDVTGSMGLIPRVLQEKLPKLHTLLLQKGYVEHPQILFGAIGDATCDLVPLQIGQFESDNRMDENLEHFVLEGGGGGHNAESYELGAYYLAYHTALDSLEKRGKKGYAFFIGDERIYDRARAKFVRDLIGARAEEDVLADAIFRDLQEKYEVFFLFAAQGSYRPEQVLPAAAGEGGRLGWRRLLGERALILEDADAVCETIALTIGVHEGRIDLDEGLTHLAELGTDSTTTASVSKALEPVAAGAAVLATATGGGLDLGDDDSDAERL